MPMKAKKFILTAAVVAASLALSASAWAGRGNSGNTGRPDWAGNGNGAIFGTVTTPDSEIGVIDPTADPTDAGDPLVSVFTHTTPSGNVKTTTLNYGVNADGENILLSMQKLITNHNGNTVSIDKIFNLMPDPPVTGETGTTTTTDGTSQTSTTQASTSDTGSGQ